MNLGDDLSRKEQCSIYSDAQDQDSAGGGELAVAGEVVIEPGDVQDQTEPMQVSVEQYQSYSLNRYSSTFE